MSRYLESVCKHCRREREKLFLKGQKCFTKCTLDSKRGKNAPGMQGARAGRGKKMSEYALRMREKQKAKRVFGLTEQQFRHYFATAEKMKGLTGENLMRLLELRLDNVLFRLGLAPSRKCARQMVNHGNIRVNEKKIDLPGYILKVNDKIAVQDKQKENVVVKKCLELNMKTPSWLKLDKQGVFGSVMSIPQMDELAHPINSQLIVELYSK
jgi:small subunit ribosomal protein S4